MFFWVIIIYKKVSFAIDFTTDLLIFIGESGNGHNYEDDEKEDDIEQANLSKFRQFFFVVNQFLCVIK